METKIISPSSYLQEYRRKYKPIETTTTSSDKPLCSTDVQTLLNRYLQDETATTFSPDTSCTIVNVETASEVIDKDATHSSETSESVVKLCESDDDSIFDDETNPALLPTTAFLGKPPITVDNIMKDDSHLHINCLRRNSSSSNVDKRSRLRHIKRRASSSPEGHRLLLDSRSRQSIGRRSLSDMSLKSLRRQDSNVSLESNASNKSNLSFKNDLLEISDEEFDFDMDIDLNSSKQSSDSDSQKLFSLFQLDSDSQKDTDSLTGYDETDGVCAYCRPLSARSEVSMDHSNHLCPKCTVQTKERYATIKEILESELGYKKDLLLIKTHFHDVLLENGLLSSSDVHTIFGNISRLIGVSQKFSDQLTEHLQSLSEESNDYYKHAAIGQLICDSSAMFLGFETYCLNYNTAVATIDHLKKDNQLFNLFLEASQNDNSALRRMDLKTFLMLPVQRVMKYPLLLKRLHKVTHSSHPDKEPIEKANEKLTNILHHINSQSKILSYMFSNSKNTNKSPKRTSFEIALTKLVLDTLQWRHDEIHFVSSGKFGFLQPGDSQWAEKLRTLRLNTAYATLVTKGKRDHLPKTVTRGSLLFPKPTTVTEAALLVVKKGNSKLQVIGEPYNLAQCLISRNAEFYDVFEIARDYVKEPFIIRPVHGSDTWYRNLKHYSMVLGGRNTRRRNALPNILLQS